MQLTIVTSPVQRRVALVVLETALFFRKGDLKQLAQPRGVAPSSRIVQGRSPSGVSTEDRRFLFQQHLHTLLMSRHDLAHVAIKTQNTPQLAGDDTIENGQTGAPCLA